MRRSPARPPRRPARARPLGAGQPLERAALALAHEQPELGQFRAAVALRARGFVVSPSGVRAIWKRHGLATALERLSARADGGARAAQLSDAQRARLQRARISRRMLGAGERDGESAGALRREQVLAAAARAFGTAGYEAASLRDIASAAGVLAGSLYYHFRSKDELFATVHTEGFRQLHAAVDRALDGVSDPWLRLEAACAAHLEQLVNGNDIAVVTSTSLFRRMRPALQRRLNRDRAAYEDRFRRLIAPLDLPPAVDRSLLRLMVLGAMNWTRVWYRRGGLSPADIARQWVRSVLRR